MKKFGQMKLRELGQGMTEYIIIVALMAVGAIGVYKAFGDVVRGQAATSAISLAGGATTTAQATVTTAATAAGTANTAKGLSDYAP